MNNPKSATSNSGYPTVSGLVDSMTTLLTLPDVYLQVKAVVEDPDSIVTDLVNTVAVDPGITARLLRLVNSAYFRVIAPVDNIRQAIHLLGMRPVHDLVLATTLTSAFGRAGSDALDAHAFWLQSVRRAVYARLLAGCCHVEETERLFLAGLLSHIGHQVMYLRLPGPTRAARDTAMTTGRMLAAVESETLGFCYADVGSELMRRWKLPENLVEPARGHVVPEPGARFALDAAIVHIADALARLHEQEIVPDRLLAGTVPTAWQITALGAGDLVALRAQAVDLLATAVGMLVDEGGA